LPAGQVKSQLLKLPQVQAEPGQAPAHFGFVPWQLTAQLPEVHLKSQELPMPQVQADPAHSPLQCGLPP
jgi:hypothetical protein